jgi:hypothetical protein
MPELTVNLTKTCHLLLYSFLSESKIWSFLVLKMAKSHSSVWDFCGISIFAIISVNLQFKAYIWLNFSKFKFLSKSHARVWKSHARVWKSHSSVCKSHSCVWKSHSSVGKSHSCVWKSHLCVLKSHLSVLQYKHKPKLQAHSCGW